MLAAFESIPRADRVIVALDCPRAKALDLAVALQGKAKWLKIGMTLYYSEGPAIVEIFKLLGYKVFLDLKCHDIPHQVAGAAASAVEAGADMITIKDMSGLIPPRRVATLVRLLKKNLSVPVDFHTHCTPGYGLASVLSAIIAGVDVVDTNCWYFAEGREY